MRIPSIAGWYRKRLRRLPRWAKLTAGLVLVFLGTVLLVKPFGSLIVMIGVVGVALLLDGISRLTAEGKTKTANVSRLVGLGLLAAAAAVFFWPAGTIQVIAIITGVSMMVGGLLDLAGVRGGTPSQRTTALLGGTAMLLFGLLTILWQDVAILIIAVAFSAKLFLTGLALIGRAVWTAEQARMSWRMQRAQQAGNIAGSALLLVLAVGLLVVSQAFRAEAPKPDDFYTYRGTIPAQPGVLLKVEPYKVGPRADVRAWRILYSTTRDAKNTPALASAFVMASQPLGGQPQPLVAWAHGTTGVVSGCAPTLRPPTSQLDSVPGADRAFDNGWVMVGTDYVGLGTKGPHSYLVGQGEGRSVLDSIRAVHQMSELTLSDITVLWGHSQGGNSVLWAGGLAGSYAPELKIAGVAASAPASDLLAIADRGKEEPFAKILGAFAARAYSNIYPDVEFDDYIRPSVSLVVRNMAARCVAEKSTLVSIVTSLVIPESIYSKDPRTGPLGERLRQNIPRQLVSAPLLVAQGDMDKIIFPDIQSRYIDGQCAAGQKLEYKTYAGEDHLSLVDKPSAFNGDLAQWTADRFAGKPAGNTCH